MDAEQFRDVVPKGCTRPALVFGVPLIPLFVAFTVVAVVAQLTTVLLMLAMIPITIIMGLITRTDDQRYRLIGLRLQCRFRNRTRAAWRSVTYSPVKYRKPQ